MNQQGFMGGYGVYPQQPVVPNNDPKSYCQTLTIEQANALRKQIEDFTLNITEKDKWAAICMHRDPATGANTINYDKMTDTVTCTICGKSFRFLDKLGQEDVETAKQNMLDILQSTKLLYLDMPVEAAKSLYTIIALIEKIPGLYKVSTGNFISHEKAFDNINYSNGPSHMQAWRALQSGAFGAGGYMQQPYYNPVYGAQPIYGQPMYGQPQAPGANPFFANPQQAPIQQPMYGQAPQPIMGQQPVAPYQPTVQGFAYNPNGGMTPQQATQAATVAPGQTTVQPMAAAPAPATPGAAQPVAQAAASDGSQVTVSTTFTA